MKKEAVDLSKVKEDVERQNFLSKNTTEKSLTQKQKDLFKELYPMTSNKTLSKQFGISVSAVQRLSYELKVYKDPSFTQHNLVESNTDKTGEKNPKTMSSYLVNSVLRMVTEAEKREVINYYKEGMDAKEILEELTVLQLVRVQKGTVLEQNAGGMWDTVNDGVDILHKMLKTLYEMEHGQEIKHTLSIDEYILRAQMDKN